jgi:hypothetical protein
MSVYQKNLGGSCCLGSYQGPETVQMRAIPLVIALVGEIGYGDKIVLKAKKSLADGPALRPDGPRWWRGRSARAQSQLGFLVSRGICYLKPRD